MPAAGFLSGMAASASDLLLPGGCAGCGAAGVRLRRGVCRACIDAVTALRPFPTRPDPAPAGLPPCVALGEYGGVLRELLLAYKDRGQYRLGRPLGRLLGQVVAGMTDGPVLLVPVPDTPGAARARFGDHLWRMARPAAGSLRSGGAGRVALARPLRAGPRADSVTLDSGQRARQAEAALRLRRWRTAGARRWVLRTGTSVVLLDDVVTTGATLATAAARLAEAGIPVAGAAVLAATKRHTRSR